MRAVALQVHIAILLHISPNPPLLPDARVRRTGGRCTTGSRHARMLPPPPPPPPPAPPVPCPHEQQGEGARSFAVPDGRSAWLRHCTGHVHLIDPAGRHRQSTQTHTTPSEQHHPYSTAPPLECIHESGGVGYEAVRPAARRNSLSTMQLNGASGLGAVRDSANASRNWLQRAAHYDGICLARWRRISVRGRFCMLPEPGDSPYGRDSSHCLSHLARWVSNRILPEAAFEMNYVL